VVFLGSGQTGFLAAFGGGVLSAWLLQKPVALFTDNVIGVTWTACWWAINYFPYARELHALLPIRLTTKVHNGNH
jgi:MFS-type transporter involved in bile tolerance (Atg22 family)